MNRAVVPAACHAVWPDRPPLPAPGAAGCPLPAAFAPHFHTATTSVWTTRPRALPADATRQNAPRPPASSHTEQRRSNGPEALPRIEAAGRRPRAPPLPRLTVAAGTLDCCSSLVGWVLFFPGGMGRTRCIFCAGDLERWDVRGERLFLSTVGKC